VRIVEISEYSINDHKYEAGLFFKGTYTSNTIGFQTLESGFLLPWAVGQHPLQIWNCILFGKISFVV